MLFLLLFAGFDGFGFGDLGFGRFVHLVIPPVERYPSVDSSYLTKRLDYFRDEESKYRLYYIPEQFQGEATKAVQQIVKGTGASAGLDGKERYPWVVPLVCLVSYLILLLASKKKGVFMLPGIFPLIFSPSNIPVFSR